MVVLQPNFIQRDTEIICSPTHLVMNRALKYNQVDFMQELADTTRPKVPCSGCRSRLANVETGKLTTEKWEGDRAKIEIIPSIEEQQPEIYRD